MATYFAACDLFFVSCGLHLVGATQEVEDFLLTIDKEMEGKTTQNKMRCAIAYKTNYINTKLYYLSFGAVTRANPSKGTDSLSLYLQLKFREAIRDHFEIIRYSIKLTFILYIHSSRSEQRSKKNLFIKHFS